MRKMFSKNQIKDIVNQGIESGEICVGKKLYQHYFYDTDQEYAIVIVDLNPDNYSLADIDASTIIYIHYVNDVSGLISLPYAIDFPTLHLIDPSDFSPYTISINDTSYPNKSVSEML